MRTEVSAELNCDRSYEDYIEIMEKTRLAYQRGWTSFYNGIPGFAITRRERHIKDPSRRWGFRDVTENMKSEFRWLDKSQPMPIDLKVYTVAKFYDPDKRPSPKVIAELAKHKDEIHPYARRYLVERMREAEARHRGLAEQYSGIADQFEP